MRKLCIAVAMLVLTAGQGVAGQPAADPAVMTTVNQFVTSFNQGDAKTAAAVCADDAVIIDEFPPHVWRGAGAMAQWAADYDVDAKKKGISLGMVTLGKVKHVDVTGDVAYVVAPADYKYKMNGKAVKESNCLFTLVLKKGEAGWRITAWSWAKN
jgi:ketosteroid isomerase-like protein